MCVFPATHIEIQENKSEHICFRWTQNTLISLAKMSWRVFDYCIFRFLFPAVGFNRRYTHEKKKTLLSYSFILMNVYLCALSACAFLHMGSPISSSPLRWINNRVLFALKNKNLFPLVFCSLRSKLVNDFLSSANEFTSTSTVRFSGSQVWNGVGTILSNYSSHIFSLWYYFQLECELSIHFGYKQSVNEFTWF